MELLLLGLLIGGAIGYLIGRRQGMLGAPDAEITPPRIVPAPSAVGPAAPSPKARRLGLSDADFVPADDILHRMQEAWEQGDDLDVDEAAEAGAGDDIDDAPAVPVAPAAPASSAPTSDAPPLPDPLADERVRRVLSRLEGQAPKGEPETPSAPGREAPTTVTEALERLAAEGYGEDLRLDGSKLACSACGTSHPTRRSRSTTCSASKDRRTPPMRRSCWPSGARDAAPGLAGVGLRS